MGRAGTKLRRRKERMRVDAGWGTKRGGGEDEGRAGRGVAEDAQAKDPHATRAPLEDWRPPGLC